MPFWGGWSDPRVEPKRGFRFVVPFPIYVPKLDRAHERSPSKSLLSNALTQGRGGPVDPEMLNHGKYGKNKYFDFLATSCTKPGFKTEVYKVTPGGATSHPIVRPNQATTYEFTPIKLELIDTYSHDIASTLTAYLYAYGELQQAPDGTYGEEGNPANHFTPGKLIGPFHNTSTPNEFHITEFLARAPLAEGDLARALAEGGHGANARVNAQMRARRWILKNPYISSVDFGTYNHGSEELAKVTLETVYDSYDYDYLTQDSSYQRALVDDPAASLTQRQVRQNIRQRWRDEGRTPGEIASGMAEVRRQQRNPSQTAVDPIEGRNPGGGRLVSSNPADE